MFPDIFKFEQVQQIYECNIYRSWSDHSNDKIVYPGSTVTLSIEYSSLYILISLDSKISHCESRDLRLGQVQV